MLSLQLLVKVTRACNLRCTYCSDWRASSLTMSDATLDRMTRNAFADPAHRAVDFVWHGGEPTLAGLAFFERAVELQRRYNRGTHLVRNTLQTNGTTMNERWLDFLARERFGVSVSVDGPRELHDETRVRVNGRGSFDSVVASLDLLRERGLAAGVLLVMSDAMLAFGPDAAWEFIRGLGVEKVNLLPVAPPNAETGRTTLPQFASHARWIPFVTRVFDLWWESGSEVEIIVLDSVMSKLAGGSPGSCVLGGSCFGSVFGVDPDGTVMHCDLFQEVEHYVLGNVLTHTFAELRESAGLRRLADENAERVAGLRSCPYFDVCAGGCPHEAFVYRNQGQSTGACCGWRPLIEHVERRAKPALEAALAGEAS